METSDEKYRAIKRRRSGYGRYEDSVPPAPGQVRQQIRHPGSREQVLTPERMEIFLKELAEHGIVGRAARVASPHSVKGCSITFYDRRKRDPEFAMAWAEALIQARSNVEAEVHRRAMGWHDETKDENGIVISKVYKFSDRMLELRLKMLAPEYREKSQVEHSVTVDAIDFEKLSPESRALLRVILEAETKKASIQVIPDSEAPRAIPEQTGP